jgi:hypothetical protein
MFCALLTLPLPQHCCFALSPASICLPACLPACARCAADTSVVLLLPRFCYCARLFAFPQHNTLPVIFKPEMPSRIGLLPLTARSGDEVREAGCFARSGMLKVWGNICCHAEGTG